MSAEGGRPLIVIGAGGHGREILDIIEANGERERFLGFVDDAEPTGAALQRLAARRTVVLGPLGWLSDRAVDYVIGIGTSSVRRSIADSVDTVAASANATALTHPSAVIGSEVVLEPGVVIGANSTVTTNVHVGRHSHVNVGCSVQHDSRIGEFVTISPGVFINGDVEIGDHTFIGTGAIITRGCTVGAGSTIGAGAVVLHDVTAGSRIMGVPGRPRLG